MSEQSPFQPVHSRRFTNGEWVDLPLIVAREIPVALVYNGISHAVMMASPNDLEDFAIGFSLTEGIVESAKEILDLESREVEGGIEVNITLIQRRLAGLKEHRRSMTGRTGCGICGTESLSGAVRVLQPVNSDLKVEPGLLIQALADMDSHQYLRKATKASHAAAWICDGTLRYWREDVGRHNALDKVIGAGVQADLPVKTSLMVVSSRCSVEMVQKTVAVGVPILAAVASPTALAIELADQWGLTLVTSLRPDSFNVLTHPQRIES
jgi:formate dehydrogenase accessory protein FdhD